MRIQEEPLMVTPVQASKPEGLRESLERVVAAGDVLLNRLKQDLETRRRALRALSEEIDNLSQTLPILYPELSNVHPQFSQAAAEIQTGQLLIAAGTAAETGDESGLREALDTVRTQQQELKQHGLGSFFFEK